MHGTRTYSPLLDVDTDDCASWYDIHDNFLVYGGYGRKGALAANDVRSYRNYYYFLPRATYAGGNGPSWADNNGWFVNNSVVLSGAADPCGVPGGYASDCISVAHNHSLGMVTAGNTIMAANFETLEVPAWCSAGQTTVQQWIARGHDSGTTVGPLPSLQSVLSSARKVLGLPPPSPSSPSVGAAEINVSTTKRQPLEAAAAASAASGLGWDQPPPPLPPIPLNVLLGNWTHEGDRSLVTIAKQNGSNMFIAFSTPCKPCCFKAGNGTISADGRHIAVAASGAKCVRLATGLIYQGADVMTIKWTARSPDGTVREWKDWVKPNPTT